ncbi:MAG: hypothetical protein DME22_25085, partial [Verrucomicrobia bacterium]
MITYTYDAVGNLLSVKRQTIDEIGPPGITSLSPSSGKQRDIVQVTMSGSGLLGARLVSGNPGITFRNVIATDQQIQATFLIAHDAPVGVATITAMSPLGNALGQFTVLAAAPLITGVRPSNGLSAGGTRVTIRGLSITPDATVNFGAAPAAEIVVLDSTTISVKSPPGAPGSVAVAVINGNGVGSLENAYTYVAPRGTVLSYGQTVTGQIAALGQASQFTFEAGDGDIVTLRMSRASSGINPSIRLLDFEDHQVAQQSAFAYAQLDLPLPAPGVYFAEARDDADDATGAFGLSLQRLNGPAGAMTMNFGTVTNRSLALPAELQAFQFAAVAGDVVRVRMSRSSGIDPRIELFDSQGRSVADTTAFADAVVDLALASGTYYFLLSDLNGDETGTYGVSLERLNNPANAKPIAYGQTLEASIDAVAEMDAYSFQAQAGDVVRVRMSRSSGIDPQIELFDSQGRSVTNITAFADAVVDVPLASSGTYYLLLSDLNGDETGAYGVSLERLKNPANAKPIAYGQTLQASIDAVAEMDAYSFQAQAGDMVRVRMSRSSGIDPKIELFDAQGRSVTNITAFADAVLDVPLASSGTYYFLLSDLNGDETGTYGVSLERLNNPANAKPIAYGQTL